MSCDPVVLCADALSLSALLLSRPEPIVPRYSRRFVSHVSLSAKDAVFVSIKGSNDDEDDVRGEEELDGPFFPFE